MGCPNWVAKQVCVCVCGVCVCVCVYLMTFRVSCHLSRSVLMQEWFVCADLVLTVLCVW